MEFLSFAAQYTVKADQDNMLWGGQKEDNICPGNLFAFPLRRRLHHENLFIKTGTLLILGHESTASPGTKLL